MCYSNHDGDGEGEDEGDGDGVLACGSPDGSPKRNLGQLLWNPEQ